MGQNTNRLNFPAFSEWSRSWYDLLVLAISYSIMLREKMNLRRRNRYSQHLSQVLKTVRQTFQHTGSKHTLSHSSFDMPYTLKMWKHKTKLFMVRLRWRGGRMNNKVKQFSTCRIWFLVSFWINLYSILVGY